MSTVMFKIVCAIETEGGRRSLIRLEYVLSTGSRSILLRQRKAVSSPRQKSVLLIKQVSLVTHLLEGG
jgi:hypothetical protein